MKQLLLCIAMVCSTVFESGGQITFLKHYGWFTGPGNSLIINSNGNYIIAGQTHYNSTWQNFSTFELNIYGDTLWFKYYDGDSLEQANQIIQTIDGGYASVGFHRGLWSNYRNIQFVKANSSGDTVWIKQIGGLGRENATGITQLNNGEYVIGGATDFNNNGLFDFYLIKTNSMGNLIWSRTYGGSQNEEANSMRKTFDDGFILGGYSESYSSGMKDFYLVKTDSSGDTLWTKNYGGFLDDVLLSIRQTADSGYIATGYSASFGIAIENMYVIKLDPNGDTLWTKTFGQPGRYSWGRDIIQTADGGFAVTGLIKTASSNGGYDFYLLKLDALGNVIWEREIKVEPSNLSYTSSEGISILQSPDGGFAIAGSYFNASTIELLFVKTDHNGLVGISELDNSTSFKMFPNPFNESTTIFLKESGINYNLNLYNCLGELAFKSDNISTREFKLNRNNLPSGLYLISITTNKGHALTQKLIIQ